MACHYAEYMISVLCFVHFAFNSFEDDADSKCKECLDKAIEHDPRNAEAFQLQASYWLSMENKQVKVVCSVTIRRSRELEMGRTKKQTENKQKTKQRKHKVSLLQEHLSSKLWATVCEVKGIFSDSNNIFL